MTVRHDPNRLIICFPGIVLLLCALLGGCSRARTGSSAALPSIEFTSVPPAEKGDPDRLEPIQGRVHGAGLNQRIVLYAGTESTWWVQPYANQPFTNIQPDSTWTSATHPGFVYAALLVGPDFRITPFATALPTQGVLARTVMKGRPPVWLRWWFLTGCFLLATLAAFGLHRLRLKQIENKLNGRFAERLAERTRVAQLLHDTLLQGVISASMQLHVAVSELPSGSSNAPALERVLVSMRQVVDEGRNTLKGLRSSTGIQDLEDSLTRVPQEFGIQAEVRVRVNANVPAMPIPPALIADLYTIGRDILVEVFRFSGATIVDVELRCNPRELRLGFRYDGRKIDAARTFNVSVLAEKIGARLKVRTRILGGNEIVLRIPSHVAFQSHAAWPVFGSAKWFRGLTPNRRGDESSD